MSEEFRSDPKAIDAISEAMSLIMEKQGHITKEQWQSLLTFMVTVDDIVDRMKLQKKRYEDLTKAYSEVDKAFKEYKARIEEA